MSSSVSECFTCSVWYSPTGTEACGFRNYMATFLHCCKCLHCHSKTWTSLQMSSWPLHSILLCVCQIFVLGHGLSLSCHYFLSFLSFRYEVGEVIHPAFQSFLTLNIHKSILQKVGPQALFDKWRNQWFQLVFIYVDYRSLTLPEENMNTFRRKFYLLRFSKYLNI